MIGYAFTYVAIGLLFIFKLGAHSLVIKNTECGGSLNLTNSVFASPNFTNSPYGSNISCNWTVNIAGGIFLIFDHFFIDGKGDFIQVSDADDIIGTYTGIQDSFIIQSLSDVIYIEFQSGFDTRHGLQRRFNGHVDYKCSVKYTAESGYFSTPIVKESSKPVTKNKYYSCTWQITNSYNLGSILSFNTFDFEYSDSFLVIMQGCPDMKGQMLANFTDQNPAHAVLTDKMDTMINLTYNSYDPPSMKGLFRTTTAECTKVKNLDVNGSHTTITSIGYPVQYLNNLECWWLIQGDVDSTLVVEFNDVNLADHRDVLVLHPSGNRSTEPMITLMGKYNVEDLPILVTDGNMMLVRFTTDDMGIAGGFSFNVSAQDLGGLVKLQTVSPPINVSFSSDGRVIYLIETDDADFQPVVRQNDWQLTCPTDYNITISFYQGTSRNGHLLGVQHNSQEGLIPKLASNTQKLLIIADRLSSACNISMQASAVYQGCNINSFSPVGSIGGNHYFDYYLRNCAWIIYPEPLHGSIIELTIEGTDINQPKITVEQGLHANTSRIVAIISNQTRQLSFHFPTTHPLVVSYVSPASSSLIPISGFYRTLQGCGGPVDIDSGSITSLHFPSAYPLNAVCTQTLYLNRSTMIHLTFDVLKIAPNDTIKIVEMPLSSDTEGSANSWSRFDVTYMAGDLPADIVLNSSSVWVTHTSIMLGPTSTQMAQGFKVEFAAMDCGGNVTSNQGQLSTPGYPSPPNRTLTCIWIVQVPNNIAAAKSSVASIVEMELSYGQLKMQNERNYIEIRDGSSVRSPLVNLLSPTNSSSNSSKLIFQSRTSSLFIKYVNKVDVGFPFASTFSTYECKLDQMCNNGVCLHDSWRCDGIDQCGDNTDEQGCQHIYPQCPAIPTNTVTKKTLGLSLTGTVILTIILVLLALLAIAKYRKRNGLLYTQFDVAT